MTNVGTSLSIAIVLLLLLWAAGLCVRYRQFALFLCFTLFTLSLSQFPIPGIGDPRYLTIAILLLQIPALYGMRDSLKISGAQLRILATFLAFSVLGLTSAAWSDSYSSTLASGLAWFVLCAVLVVFAALLTYRQIFNVMLTFLLLTVGLSAVLLIVGYPNAFLGGRARGLFANGNGLAIACAMLAPLTLVKDKLGWRLLWWLPVGVCIATASRAGALELAVGSVAVWLRGRSSTLKGVTLVAAASVAALLFPLVSNVVGAGGDLLITRTNNSREAVWSSSWSVFTDHLLFGAGLGSVGEANGSSYLKLLAELGVVGAVLGALILVQLISGSRPSRLALAITLGGAVDCVFEGWLFTAGSVFCLLTYILVFAAMGRQMPPSLGSMAPSRTRENVYASRPTPTVSR